uniref:RNA 2',3'-cyclic phosphodiesterase n=1 Tax=Ningiella ruwaisensis TaxID=2364274 RepID=UPI00109F36E1|nr:RNA 2',3'-cyclic phosphodiesterase [Ningiella ruwaisensis]
MRYFLGLDIDAKSKLAIEQWRNKALPHFVGSVPAANFHITLVFLGQVQAHQLEDLTARIDEIAKPKIDLHLDSLGYWSKPKILFLGATATSQGLIQLANQLGTAANGSGLNVRQGIYIPHLTLVRKVKDNPPNALISPSFRCQFSHMHLFESVSTKTGVRYPIRATWILNEGKN